MKPERPDLMDGFERPTREQWLQLTEKSLKGAPFDSLVSRSADGLEIQPLYTAQDAKAPLPGRPEPRAAEGDWDIRAIVDQADPAAANAAALDDLANGANSLLVKLDPSGAQGCAVGSAQDMARLLDGVVLEVAPTALDAGFLGPQAAEWLAEAAKASPGALLELHMDPLGALAEAGRSPGPIKAHISRAAETGARLATIHPRASMFLASGRAVHEAGGSEAQELGFAAAAALAYAKALVAAGMDMGQAFGAIRLAIMADGDYLLSIAKLRAARAIWDRMASACGAGAPARIEARSSRRMLAGLDAWTNLLRLTAAGFAAAAGGAGAVVLEPFTAPLGRPTALARRQARNVQLVLMQESHLGRVRDPAAGAWFVEAMSRELAEQGWSVLQAIEKQGGAVAALEGGFVAANVEGAAKAAQAAAAHAHPGQVGVSRFPDLNEQAVPVEPAGKARAAKAPDPRLPGEDAVCPRLEPIRLSQPFEAARARAAALPSPPTAALVVLGKAGESAERVAAARNLLAAAGLKLGGDDAAAKIAVLAGSDAMLEAEGVEAVRKLKTAGRLVLVAAREPAHPHLRQAGADGFIHAGQDAVRLAAELLGHLEGVSR